MEEDIKLFSNGLTQEDLHEYRKQIDSLIVCAKDALNVRPPVGGRELALAHTKLQEAKMWVGKVLEELGSKLPTEFQDKSN